MESRFDSDRRSISLRRLSGSKRDDRSERSVVKRNRMQFRRRLEVYRDRKLRQISLAFYIIGHSLQLRATRRKRRAVLSGVCGNLGPFSPPRRRKGATVERSPRSLNARIYPFNFKPRLLLVKMIPIRLSSVARLGVGRSRRGREASAISRGLKNLGICTIDRFVRGGGRDVADRRFSTVFFERKTS